MTKGTKITFGVGIALLLGSLVFLSCGSANPAGASASRSPSAGNPSDPCYVDHLAIGSKVVAISGSRGTVDWNESNDILLSASWAYLNPTAASASACVPATPSNVDWLDDGVGCRWVGSQFDNSDQLEGCLVGPVDVTASANAPDGHRVFGQWQGTVVQ